MEGCALSETTGSRNRWLTVDCYFNFYVLFTIDVWNIFNFFRIKLVSSCNFQQVIYLYKFSFSNYEY